MQEIKRGYVFFEDGRKEPLYLHPDLLEGASDKQKALAEELRIKDGFEEALELDDQLTFVTELEDGGTYES